MALEDDLLAGVEVHARDATPEPERRSGATAESPMAGRAVARVGRAWLPRAPAARLVSMEAVTA